MKRRWNSNVVVLVILGGVLLLVGFDVGRRYLVESKPGAASENPTKPKFAKGDEAPDFELPDKAGVKHTLSSLVKKDTVLCFLCGCDSCRKTQTYLGKLTKLLGPNAPDVISVSSQAPEFEDRYREITGLPQKLLYEKHGGDVMEKYKGHPCPRIYKLDGTRHITWIGPSTLDLPRVSDMSVTLASNLGFRNTGEPVSAKPLAPIMEATPMDPRRGDPNMPPGTAMGPNGPMPAHIPTAPGSGNPPGVGGAPGTFPLAKGNQPAPHLDTHPGHDH